MAEQIRVIFTLKANSALENLITSFNLEESPEDYLKKTKEGKSSNIATIDKIIKDFVSQNKTDKDLIGTLQSNLNIPAQTAEQISKEIITKIVPFLEKADEEKLKDKNYRNELDEKIWGKPKEENVSPGGVMRAPAFLNVEENEKLLQEERKNIAPTMETPPARVPKKTSRPSRPASSGSDKYRESI